MVRGNASNRTPDDPGEGAPGEPSARQREVLAQFEAAIAGMDARQIQVGLRHLLGGARGANLASGFRGADVASRSHGANAAVESREADVAGEGPVADEAGGSRGAGVAGEELTAIGWINGDGSPLTGAEAAATTSGTHAVLRRLGVLPAGPDGVAFARAALSTWPGTA